MSQRFEGKNLDDALTNASQTLGVERYQLTYHVLLEKRGFLGGVKRIVIEAEINEAAVEPPTQTAAHSGPLPARRGEGGRRPGEGRRRGGREDRGGGRRRRGGNRREESDLQPGDFEQFVD